ncbi:MAG: tetratricopeptide repeat protein [Candidatus Obscuribacterales bacterium]|nr:tetratricopeptide repeat protein [Candidatus Obscuribacterales bacterium]
MKRLITSAVLVVSFCSCNTAYGADDWEEEPSKDQSKLNGEPSLPQKTVDRVLWKNLWDRAQVEIRKGRIEESVTLLESAFDTIISSAASSGNTPLHETVEALSSLYKKLGRFDKIAVLKEKLTQNGAPQYLVRSLNEDQDPSGSVKLIDKFIAENRLAEAEQLCVSLLKQLAGEYEHSAKVVDRLVRIYVRQEKYAEAEVMLGALLRPLETQIERGYRGDKERIYVAYLFADLSLVYMGKREYEKAETLMLKSSDILAETLPGNNPKLIVNLSDLALLHSKMGKLDKALEEYEKSYAMARKQPLIGDSSRQTIASNYSKTLRTVGKLDSARLIERREKIVDSAE